jgi:hypothetical protein
MLRILVMGDGRSMSHVTPKVLSRTWISICPGRYFADNSVWIVIATILSIFEIQRVKDELGNDIIPPVAFDTGLARYVLSDYDRFKCPHLLDVIQATPSHMNVK